KRSCIPLDRTLKSGLPMQPSEPSRPGPVRHHPAPSRWPVALVLISAMLTSALLLVLYVSPDWAARWRWACEQVAADARYARRQAELKAEAEAAEDRLAALDRRVQLVSLGFREVARKVTPVVVHIGNEVEVGEHVLGPSFYDFETNRHYQERAEGSGIL